MQLDHNYATTAVQCTVSRSQFAWRPRAARRCEARRHEGHDVSGGALARGSPLEEDLVPQPRIDAALLVAAGRGRHQAVDGTVRADLVRVRARVSGQGQGQG